MRQPERESLKIRLTRNRFGEGARRKVFETIDLNAELEPQLHKLDRLSKRATVFFSYAQTDHEIAEPILRALRSHDYRLWFDQHSIAPGESFEKASLNAIEAAATQGFVLILLTKAGLNSQWVRWEIDRALQMAAKSTRPRNIIPIVAEEIPAEMLPPALAEFQWFDLSSGPIEERIELLIREMKTREMQ